MPRDDPPPPRPVTAPVRVGVSSCLLGNAVRFDGNHKRNALVCEVLDACFEWVALCPEAAIGLGVPREPIHLRRIDGGLRAVQVRHPERDVTEALLDFGRETARRHPDLCGYVLKKDSPSCGMERVRVYDARGENARRDGVGRFAAALREALPLLPVEEEGRLGDPRLRENFVLRVFVYHRWQELIRAGLDAAGLVAFHTGHKLLVLAHDPGAYRQLGRLVAGAGGTPSAELGRGYFDGLMQALATPATPARQVNVLQHIAGYFRKDLDSADRSELAACIEDYRLGLVPLAVPLTLLNHHLRRHPKPYIARQHYLEPYPRELRLRNH